MAHEVSPTARALVALEVIQGNPGITAQQLGDRLGVSDRAVRRYVAILREAELPVEAVSGPYGGYRAGRGLRLPPLMFSAAEAMGLVMAVLEGHRYAADPGDLVGGALAKIVRSLPERVAGPVRAVRETSAAPPPAPETQVSPELTSRLIEACAAARPLSLVYRLGPDKEREMEIEPWAVVLRHSRWYLLGWSRTRQAQRALRVDRIATAEAGPGTFTPPPELDARGTLEEHLSQGWTHPVDVLIDAVPADVERWLPRSLGRLEPDGQGRTRLRASTEDADWYVRRLALLPAPFRVLGSDPVRRAMAELARQLAQAAGAGAGVSRPESADGFGQEAGGGGQLGLGGEREAQQEGGR
jgi:predicted DNA-binding transcriptional regulator YafY